MAREKADVATPVFRGANQTVEQKERAPRACALVVNLRSADQDESLFNLGKSLSHNRSRLNGL
jgi:hypothetical protein